MNVHTKSVHFSADAKLLAFIEKKLSKLDQFFDQIFTINVVLKLENSGQVKDKIAEVRIKIPGSVLYVKEISKSFEESVDAAAQVLKRQLLKYKERLRANH
ncbi:MAG: ribosome-associated translation inhibitor RaiA [Saprospiraceae bacterium]